jgi:ABC-type Mn2+/Zn2+ transport system ATPase subunit
MPRIKHLVEHDYVDTFRAASVASMFDVPVADKLTKAWDIDIPIEQREWKIGLIIGASGSGKSTIAELLFGDNFHRGFNWSGASILDDFPAGCGIQEITETLSRVGFSSPPAWLLPYAKLSNGQKFRAELARCLCEYKELFVFDEFTSVVDRQVAQVSAWAFQKSVRKSGKQFVAVSCHEDIEAWLQPDWVLDMSTETFKWGCLRRPELHLEIRRIHHSHWRLFSHHHYLTSVLSNAAWCYGGFINGRLVAFDAWLPFFGRLKRDNKKGRRGHRSVVLPDYQGLGIGNALFMFVCRMYAGAGYRVFSATGHPAEIKKRRESKEWRMTGCGRSSQTGGKQNSMRSSRASNRLIYRSEFIGQPMEKAEALRLIQIK